MYSLRGLMIPVICEAAAAAAAAELEKESK